MPWVEFVPRIAWLEASGVEQPQTRIRAPVRMLLSPGESVALAATRYRRGVQGAVAEGSFYDGLIFLSCPFSSFHIFFL